MCLMWPQMKTSEYLKAYGTDGAPYTHGKGLGDLLDYQQPARQAWQTPGYPQAFPEGASCTGSPLPLVQMLAPQTPHLECIPQLTT